jgi:hypothetical protein
MDRKLHRSRAGRVIPPARGFQLRATELALSADQLERLDKASALELGYPYGFMSNIQGRW